MENKPQEKHAREGIEPHTGLVAVFDLLGFRKIISQDDVAASISLIQEAFRRRVGETIRFPGHSVMTGYNPSFVPEYLIFADTILLHTPTPGTMHPECVRLFFVQHCCRLMALLFSNGLPARGGITSGKYFVGDNCFAGKPIVDAEELGKRLKLSGCKVSSELQTEFMVDQDIAKLFFNHITPGGKEAEMLLNYLPLVPDFESLTKDQVERQFLAHGKTLDAKSRPKFDNTWSFVEHSKQVLHSSPYSDVPPLQG